MDNKDIRRAAAQEFMESLEDELKENLMAESPPEQKKKPLPAPTPSRRDSLAKNQPSQFTLSELEEAIEDIDRFMSEKKKPLPETEN
ncbi:MAG: hypothetical protein SXA11_17500 [Cyanobacteriota bacterium]|nr:hypothetical protein [Cyanobacteriota bacterium]